MHSKLDWLTWTHNSMAGAILDQRVIFTPPENWATEIIDTTDVLNEPLNDPTVDEIGRRFSSSFRARNEVKAKVAQLQQGLLAEGEDDDDEEDDEDKDETFVPDATDEGMDTSEASTSASVTTRASASATSTFVAPPNPEDLPASAVRMPFQCNADIDSFMRSTEAKFILRGRMTNTTNTPSNTHEYVEELMNVMFEPDYILKHSYGNPKKQANHSRVRSALRVWIKARLIEIQLRHNDLNVELIIA